MLNRKTLLALIYGLCLCAGPAAATETDHQRVIALKGTQNTRDIGGYQTDDGREVRWGKILRSDNLSRLRPEDFQQLEDMGLRTVIDLRTPKEVKNAPTNWQGESPPQIFDFPIGKDDGVWLRAQGQLLRKKRFSRKTMLNHFVTGYETIPVVGLESYQRLMTLVLDESNWPLLIHCSAGKDRTGVAVALILEILGVKREIIMDDYLLTNEVARTHEQAATLAAQQSAKRTTTGSFMGSSKPPGADAYFPLVGVMPEMLNGFYGAVQADYGSMDDYLTLLGVDQTAREALVLTLTE